MQKNSKICKKKTKQLKKLLPLYNKIVLCSAQSVVCSFEIFAHSRFQVTFQVTLPTPQLHEKCKCLMIDERCKP